MAHVVVIPSTRRPEVLAATVEGLSTQTQPADLIIVSIVTEEDAPARLRSLPGVRVVLSERGSSVQRNTALTLLEASPGLVSYLDDDVELRPDYFESARRFFDASPDVVLMTGLVLADGSGQGEISRADGLVILGQDDQTVPFVRDVRSAYGCNMTARGDIAAKEPFDERMRLYAWQEDNDFSVRMGRHGRVVHYSECKCVHLATGTGRVNGRAFGFAQVVNPFYMWRKGTKTGRELLRDWSRYVGGNTLNALGRRRSKREDRSGRLIGNVLGMKEVVLHGGRPESVERVARKAT